MLDSLVRVSRRVGWGADMIAEDLERLLGSDTGPPEARGQGAL